MATYLADTNVLLRLADPASPQHAIATQTLTHLLNKGDEVDLATLAWGSSHVTGR